MSNTIINMYNKLKTHLIKFISNTIISPIFSYLYLVEYQSSNLSSKSKKKENQIRDPIHWLELTDKYAQETEMF
jgi:hypothetical protein